MKFVLDASAALSWCFEDEATPASDHLLDLAASAESVLVPAHWPAEMLSALLQGKRRRRIKDDAIDIAVVELARLPILIFPPVTLVEIAALKKLSEMNDLSPYDAIYLALALRERVPLATSDASLRRAAHNRAVQLL